MIEPTLQDLKDAVIQMDGKLDAILETIAHMSRRINDMDRLMVVLSGRVRDLEEAMPKRAELPEALIRMIKPQG